MRNMGTFVQEIYGKIGSTEERNLGRKKSNIYLPLHLSLTTNCSYGSYAHAHNEE